MKRTLTAAILVLPLLAAPARAGWFGPSDADECAAEYAATGATVRLIGYARQQCRIAFDKTKPAPTRAYALCMAKGIQPLKVEQGIHLVRKQCEVDAPPPRCAAGQYYAEASGTCARNPA